MLNRLRGVARETNLRAYGLAMVWHSLAGMERMWAHHAGIGYLEQDSMVVSRNEVKTTVTNSCGIRRVELAPPPPPRPLPPREPGDEAKLDDVGIFPMHHET